VEEDNNDTLVVLKWNTVMIENGTTVMIENGTNIVRSRHGLRKLNPRERGDTMYRKNYLTLILIFCLTSLFGQQEFKEFKDSMNVSKRFFSDNLSLLDSLEFLEKFIWEAKFEKKKKCGKFEIVEGRLDLNDSLATNLSIGGNSINGIFTKVYDGTGYDRTYELVSDKRLLKKNKLMFVVIKIACDILIADFFYLKENYKSKNISRVIFTKLQ